MRSIQTGKEMVAAGKRSHNTLEKSQMIRAGEQRSH
jgi:hypothetical protein